MLRNYDVKKVTLIYFRKIKSNLLGMEVFSQQLLTFIWEIYSRDF